MPLFSSEKMMPSAKPFWNRLTYLNIGVLEVAVSMTGT